MRIEELLKYGERITFECKKAKTELPKSVWETYSSFANTKGGTIILGIKENLQAKEFEERFTPEGVDDPERLVKDFWNTINNDDKINANILVDDHVSIQTYKGCSLICIEVPQADYRLKPIYINGNPMKGTFKRNHEGDYHCTEDEVKAMIRDASDSGNDGGLLDGFTMDDIDMNTLNSYRIEYKLRNPDHVWNGLNDKEFLRNLGGYAVDRLNGKEGLTTAGLLMFGKGLSIRERFDNIRMDYIDQSQLVGELRWTDRLTYDGTWENNLYNFFKRVIPKLGQDIKKPFKLDGISRIDDTPVHIAIREAFVNLVIHSDYLTTGVLKIVKTDNGFIFSNPGSLKLPIPLIYEGGYSKARNPRIQTMFRMIGLGDNIGSGFPTILSTWTQESWRKPDLSENLESHQVELRLWMISLMPEECSEYLIHLYGQEYVSLSANEQIVLATAYLEKEVSNQRLQAVLDLHPTDIGKLLSGLVQKGMLVVNSKGRWSTYKINNDFVKLQPEISEDVLQEYPNLLRGNTKIVFDYICANGFITTQMVIEITSITTLAGASALLNRLIDAKLVEKVQMGRHFIYQKI